MTVSLTTICNMAIVRLGGNPIGDITDETAEADACLFYHETSRDLTLEKVDWTFARKSDTIVPLSGASAGIVGSEFSNRFQLPSDCITIRKISFDGSFKDRVIWEKEGRTVLANAELLYIKYTMRNTNPASYSAGFAQMFATQLAADICVLLTGDKKLEQSLRAEVENLVDTSGGMDSIQNVPAKQKAYRLSDARRFGWISHG